MRLLIALIPLCRNTTQTFAMSITGYEKTKAMAESTDPNRNMARISMESYFQGLAESLRFLQGGSQRIYFQDKPLLCFHSNVNISGALLRGVLDGELAKPALYAESLGRDWKDYQIPAVLFPALLRLYPCPI